MQKSQEYQFQLQFLINDSQIEIQELHETSYGNNNFREALIIKDISRNGEIIMKLQNMIKSQYLIIGNQEKQKGYAIKKLECEIRKAIEKYIEYRDAVSQEKGSKRLLLNEKDLQDLSPNLDTSIPKFIKQLHTVKNMMKLFKESRVEPTASVLDDIVNFFPNFNKNIEYIIRAEIEGSSRVQNIFESEYSFHSKVINHIRHRYQLEIFAESVLSKGIDKLKTIKCELNIEFSEEYERIKEAVGKTKHLKMYVNNKGEYKEEKVYRDIEEILHIPVGEDNSYLIYKFVEIMSSDAEGTQGLKEEFSKRMDVTLDYVNVKIGLLTMKSIAYSSQEIQNIVSIFAKDLLQSIDAFPLSVREMVRVFEEGCRQKFKEQYKSSISEQFIMKTLFSKWIFTEMIKIYQHSCPNLSKQTQNTNFSVICHILQKILYRQEFYESDKYYLFNPLIAKYREQSETFFKELGVIDPIASQELIPECNISVGLLSFETIKYVLSILRENIVEYIEFQPYHQLQGVFSRGTYQMYTQKYSASNLYILSTATEFPNLMKTFEPKTKLNRLVIEFLQAIPYLTQPTHLFTLIEQYKYGKEISSITKIPVELYTNYLSALISPTQPIEKIAESIQKQLTNTKSQQKRIRMLLQSRINYYVTIQKSISQIITRARQMKMRIHAQEMILNLVVKFKCFLKQGESLDWSTSMEGVDKKLMDKSVIVLDSANIKGFLKNIAHIYESEKIFMGENSKIRINELYNQYVEHVTEIILREPQSSIDLLLKVIKEMMGEYLFEKQMSGSFSSSRDSELLRKVKEVQFTSLSHLEPKYAQEEELLLIMTQPILSSLSHPSSPEGILQKLKSVTEIFQNIILSTGKASDITADIQIPLALFVMIKSKIINLYTLSNFVYSFILSETMSSILGQILTLLHSVVDLLENINAAKLGLSEEEYSTKLSQAQLQ